MKWIFLAVLLSGCAETRIYENGRLIASMQGDYTNVTLKTDHTYFHADIIDHSKATAATYTGATALVGGIGAGVATGILAIPH